MSLVYPLEGGCVCGKLRYRVNAQPLVVMACHCDNCKRRTGSAFALSMLTLAKDFEVTSGETIAADVPGGSGALHRQQACPSCLARTHTEMLAHRELVNVRPGTLDKPGDVAPAAQIWTNLALPWALIPGVPSFAENPPDMPALIGAWRAAHGPA